MRKDVDDRTLQSWLPGIKIHPYNTLSQFDRFDQILDADGRALILYLTEGPDVGHWTCVWEDRDSFGRPGDIHFFDPYGIIIDHEFRWVPMKDRVAWGEAKPFLSQLIAATGRVLDISHDHFQSDKPDISTCGRHCAVRLRNKAMSDEEYYAWIRSLGPDPDATVTAITLTYDRPRT